MVAQDGVGGAYRAVVQYHVIGAAAADANGLHVRHEAVLSVELIPTGSIVDAEACVVQLRVGVMLGDNGQRQVRGHIVGQEDALTLAVLLAAEGCLVGCPTYLTGQRAIAGSAHYLRDCQSVLGILVILFVALFVLIVLTAMAVSVVVAIIC
jgi:hypothetical protein